MKFYDIRIDEWREFTQEDLDQHLSAIQSYGRFITAIRKALDDLETDRIERTKGT